jgi:hypothetical protein
MTGANQPCVVLGSLWSTHFRGFSPPSVVALVAQPALEAWLCTAQALTAINSPLYVSLGLGRWFVHARKCSRKLPRCNSFCTKTIVGNYNGWTQAVGE